MTETNELSIFDEIVNCGILEEDSILNLGAGHKEGKFLETLLEYNGTFGGGLVKAVDADPKRIKTLTKKFKNENVKFYETSIQNYIEVETEQSDWVVLTGIFDNYLYGNTQHDYIISVIKNYISLANKGLIISLKEKLTDEFSYEISYFFTYLYYNFQKFTIKKVEDGNYIFCIFK